MNRLVSLIPPMAFLLAISACRSDPPASATAPPPQDEIAELLRVALSVAREGQTIRAEAAKQSADAAQAVDAAREVARTARGQVDGRRVDDLPAIVDDPNERRLRAMEHHVLASAGQELGDLAEMAAERTEDPQTQPDLAARATEWQGRDAMYGDRLLWEVAAVSPDLKELAFAACIHEEDALHAPVYEASDGPSSPASTPEIRVHGALPMVVFVETAAGPRRARMYSNAVRVDAAVSAVPVVTLYQDSATGVGDGWAAVKTGDAYSAFFPERRFAGVNRLGAWCTLMGGTMAFVTPTGAIWFQRGDGYEVVELGPRGRIQFASGGDEAVVTLPGRGTHRVQGIKSDAPQAAPGK